MTPRLYGLVLAGGESRRMGRDKGTLVLHGAPQAERQWQLLDSVCERAFVSVNAAQASREPYRQLPLVIDEGERQGPMTGLLSAASAHPDVAWLVLAVDMPFVDDVLLRELIAARDPSLEATAFRHGGMIEPLCAIWEPSSLALLRRELDEGRASPRRFLEARSIAIAPLRAVEVLRSVNVPEDLPGNGGGAAGPI